MNKSDEKDYFYYNIVTYLNDLLSEEKNRDNFLLNKNRIEETLHIFREFYCDDDSRYFDKFYNSFMLIYTSDRLCGYHNSVFLNRLYNSYFINLYLVMKSYKSHRINDDFDSFSIVVDDVNGIDIEDYYLDGNSFNCGKKELCLSLVERLIVSENYNNMINTRNLVKKLIIFDDLDDDLTDVGIVMKMCMNGNFDSDVLEALLDKDNDYYYSESISEKSLFFYLNNKLKESIENERIRKDVFLIVSDLNSQILNGSVDYFVKTMEIVFDSDSYIELLDKLSFLKRISSGININDFFFELKKIKDTYRDKNVVFPLDLSFINMISKPKSILLRMKKSYLKINNDISLDVVDDIYNSATDLYSFVDMFNFTFKDKELSDNNKKEQVKVKEKRFLSMFKRVK